MQNRVHLIKNRLNLIRSYLLDELDKTIALIGVIFSSILTIWLILVIGQPMYIMMSILCFIVCTGYLIIRRFFHPSSIHSLEELRCSTRFYITLNILFFLLLSYSIISMYLRPDHYIRPLGYFIATTLLAVIVSYEILFLSPQKLHVCFVLCKIIIIGLSLEYSQILIFPNVVGADPWWHQWFTLKILNNGYIPEGLAYSKLPLMHLMIGITSLVTDLGYKMATMVSISSLQVICDALFIFLLGKFLISTKVGLLAALLLEIATYHICFGFWTIPNTVAATLILPIMFIIFKIRKDMPFVGTLVALFLMGTLVLTHTVTAMCLSILFYAFWAGSEAYTKLFQEEKNLRLVTLNISVLFSMGMLAYWTYVSGHIMSLANLIKWGFRSDLFQTSYQYLSEVPFWEQIFKHMGTFLFFSLSFIGCFYMISKPFRNRNRFSTTIGSLLIFCFTSFSLISEKNIIASRWYYFSQILLAIPLSLSLLLLCGIFKHKLLKGLLMTFTVFTLSFLLIMSPVANMDNHLFSQISGVRSAFTESELQTLDTISEIWNGTLGGDFYYMNNPYRFQFNKEFENIADSLYTGNFSNLQEILIIVRQEIWNRPLSARGVIFRIKEDPCIALEDQDFSRIYDCGSTSGYLKP